MGIPYEAPSVVDYGSIADHTFDNPGSGDKANTPLTCDGFDEASGPGTAPPVCNPPN